MLMPARHTCPACKGDGTTCYPLADTVIAMTCWTCDGRGLIRDWTNLQIRALDAAAVFAALAALCTVAAYSAGLPLIPATILTFLEG